MTQPSELAGGAGHTFEDVVTAYYLAALLCEAGARGISDRIVTRVAVQQRSLGDPLDDLIVDFRSPTGDEARLSLQLKRSLAISSAKTNGDFREIIRDSWRTLQKPDFREGIDRFGGGTDEIAASKLRAVETLCEMARAHPVLADFEARFAPGGNANKTQARVKADIAVLIEEEIGTPCPPADLHRFLAHFLLLRFDYPNEGAADPPAAINLLRGALAPEQADKAPLIWDRLCRLARQGAGKSEQFGRPALVRVVSPVARLLGAPSYRGDLDRLQAIARSSLRDIDDDVTGTRLNRAALQQTIRDSLASHRFVQIHGLPGAGKSVLLRRIAEADLAAGPILFLKADRLQGASWAAYATSHGLTHTTLEALLVELAAVGSSTLYLDGIDRIAKAHRAIVTDLIREILGSELLQDWRILVTLRDSGIEPLRDWLPDMFRDGGIGIVEVGELNNDEAETLAAAEPSLRPLLFGPKPVREIVRRPFFAKILSQNFAVAAGEAGFAPQSEVDLIENWWRRGGYNADGAEAGKRQRALLDLGGFRARNLGRPIALSSLLPATLDMIDLLRADGILQEVRLGHTVRFAHDIFFEWSFFHRLVDRADDWPEELKGVGEPPVLGRVVELLSQAEFARGDDWPAMLARLKASDLRSQWTRAWLLGPLGVPSFDSHEERFTRVVEADDYRLLRRTLVWFQAERTTPNSRILSSDSGMSRDLQIRAADFWAWPSDFASWRRLIDYLLARIPAFPVSLVPEILAVFEVWQNALSAIENPTSREILAQTDRWLRDAEDWRDRDRPHVPDEKSVWQGLQSSLENLETSLRRLQLRSAATEPALVGAYLERLRAMPGFLDRIFSDIIGYSFLLAQSHPELLADLTLVHLREELPADKIAREEDEAKAATRRRQEALAKPPEQRTKHDQLVIDHVFSRIGFSDVSHFDWETLAVDRHLTDYFPASPLREPFHALFASAPAEALRVVAELSNHAMTAWRQLHKLDPDRGATPIALEIEFPWRTQQFWGGRREYLWSRGIWAPNPLACAYLSLDQWAFAELERGRDANELIQQIVTGNECVAVLGIAAAIALQGYVVSDTVEPILASQRLWRADIERSAQEISVKTSSLIGFKPGDTNHAEAINAINNRDVRGYDLRALVPSYVLNTDKARAGRMQATIQSFETDLPYEFEEQRNSPDARKTFGEFARTMVEWAKPENFQVFRVEGEEGRVAVQHTNPQADTPAARAKLAKAQQTLTDHMLFLWANESLEARVLSARITVVEAMDLAPRLDRSDLFDGSATDPEMGMRRGAVAATAAAVLVLRDEFEVADRDWAREVTQRALSTPELKTELWSSVSVIPWHPCNFAAMGLAADLRAGTASQSTAGALLRLLAHPLEHTSLVAFQQLVSLWDVLPRLSWCGLSLALALCHIPRGLPGGGSSRFDPAHDAADRAAKVAAATTAYETDGVWPDLPPPPPAWISVLKGDERHYDEIAEELEAEGSDVARWREPDDLWYSQRAAKLLAALPGAKIMADPDSRQRFQPYCATLLGWTISKVAPPWDRPSRGSGRREANLFEWCDAFPRLIGRLAGHFETRELLASIVEPICALGDEPCFSLLTPFTDSFICAHVLDAASLPPSTLPVLEQVVDRLLRARDFNRSAYRAGELSGRSVPALVDALLFVVIERADLAARFVNGDWSEIGLVMSVIDRLIRAAGWASYVMSRFLTLCERARDAYPADAFADQVLALLALGPSGLSAWHGTLIPARVAGLVQHFATRESPMPSALAQKLLRILDALVDLGDRRSAALQISDAFRDVRVV